ncbi:M20/M25/M40 family metallo-hydrolase, partial [uncultured Parasutterella sp.]
VHYLNQHRDFAGKIVAVFQPGEEGYAGAKYMLEDGLVEKFGIEEFYALHCEPSVDVGKVGFISGYATANADVFKIKFTGKGGHG